MLRLNRYPGLHFILGSKNSNTTNVKVKLTGGNPDFIYGQNSNTTNVKVKQYFKSALICNICNSNTTNVKVKLEFYPPAFGDLNKFKYNQC